jgi:CHAT domain-containing protein
LRGEAQPVTPEQAIALVPDARTALLEFVETEEGFYLFALTRGRTRRAQSLTPTVRAYPVKLSRHQLAEQVTSFQQLIARREEGIAQPARELYDLLLGPAQEQLAGKTSLVMVPDGVLWRLPFQALQPAENRYLLEEQTISYAPSLTTLRAMQRRRNPADRRALPALLALGNPELGKETVERVKVMLGDEPLEPLPEAEKEVTTISQLYRAGQSKVLLGAEASEEQAKAEAGKYQALHLAAHGLLSDATPMYSHLLLARAEEAGKEDGLLEAWEMLQWELQARIAVLPVCTSPPVRAGWGNGTTGLAWALFVAGCPTTLISQWKVRSESTTELMAEFHRHLSTRPPAMKAQAWRAAAMKLMQHEQFRRPFYWSGFWMVGDGF